jgi:ubiquinol-cytochrome c reductase cytochrome b subunit
MNSNETVNAAPSGGPLSKRALDWFDERTGIRHLTGKVLDEPIPGGARWAYVFGSGLLFILLSQVVTGVALALYYTPTAETAHTSVAYITKQVAGGSFLRSLHSYGSSAMIIVLALHFLQTFVYGSFKGRRELLWMSGALLSFLILGMGFTGYLLPWDQKAYFATTVGTNIAGQIPLIGTLMARVLRGGDTIGTLTLSRFYVAHVFLIPAIILMFVGAHVLLFRKAGPAGPVTEDPVSPKLAREPFYPRQVLFDMGFVLVIIAVLSGLSYLRPVTLGPIANPADSHFLPRPEWYYLPMFEWLKFWEGPAVVLGVIVIPGLVAAGFFLLPFLDRRLERKIWRRPIPALAVAIVVSGMVFLGVKSQMDDKEGPTAQQLAQQQKDEKAYSATPFEPYTKAPEGASSGAATAQIADPLVSKGKGIFNDRGCNACHGDNGTGTALAPSLVGITTKLPQDRLIALLHSPNAKMMAGGMPPVDASKDEMTALLAYLAALGSHTPNSSARLSSPSDVPVENAKAGLPAPVATPLGPSPNEPRTARVSADSSGTMTQPVSQSWSRIDRGVRGTHWASDFSVHSTR